MRRRGAAAASEDVDNEDNDEFKASRSTPSSSTKPDTRSPPDTSYANGENGHKIAFDPEEMSKVQERNKQPKLTMMEEILLLGLKDKQVSFVRWDRSDTRGQNEGRIMGGRALPLSALLSDRW